MKLLIDGGVSFDSDELASGLLNDLGNCAMIRKFCSNLPLPTQDLMRLVSNWNDLEELSVKNTYLLDPDFDHLMELLSSKPSLKKLCLTSRGYFSVAPLCKLSNLSCLEHVQLFLLFVVKDSTDQTRKHERRRE